MDIAPFRSASSWPAALLTWTIAHGMTLSGERHLLMCAVGRRLIHPRRDSSAGLLAREAVTSVQLPDQEGFAGARPAMAIERPHVRGGAESSRHGIEIRAVRDQTALLCALVSESCEAALAA
jgi:hypothetical protein